MNKAQIITAVAERTGTKKKDADACVNAFISCIEESLARGEKVQLTGFGVFEVRDRKKRRGRNPRKPEETVDIPPSRAPFFKAGKALKDQLNNENR